MMSIVENVVVPFLRLPVPERWGIVYGVFLLAGLAGFLQRTGAVRLHRGGYIALSALALGYLLILPALFADYGDRLPRRPLVAGFAVLFGGLLSGFGISVIARFRALDAFGSKGWALLAFIPVANLVLFFAPSRNRDTYERRDSLDLIQGANGIIGGLIILATALTVQHAMTDGVARRSTEPGDRIERTVDLAGLRTTIRDIAGKVRIGQLIGPFTLTQAEADGTTLRLTLRLRPEDGAFLPTNHRFGVINGLCRDEDFYRPLILQGATIQLDFIATDGGPAGRVDLDGPTCGL